MRNIIIAFLLFALTGCMEEQYNDRRPPQQVKFISIAQEWRDTVNAAGDNNALRQQLLSDGVNAVKEYISDSLQLQFRGWEARVLSVASDPESPGSLVAFFGMNLDGGKMTEKTRYQSAIFNSSTDKPEPVYPGIRDLKTGDIVRIDGNFKTLQKTIDIDSYNDLSRSKNVLDNPEFRVEITAVEEI